VRRLIIDGYSLLHRDPEFATLRDQHLRLARERLIRKIDRLATALAPRVELVFDGRAEGGRSPADTNAIHVLYSPGHKTADTVIEQLVHEDPDPSGVCVVTSDRLERETITAAGAQAMSCTAFLEHLAKENRTVERAARPTPGRASPFTLGDRFPKLP
jgi:predicted RNA-binding protein with PIN domain